MDSEQIARPTFLLEMWIRGAKRDLEDASLGHHIRDELTKGIASCEAAITTLDAWRVRDAVKEPPTDHDNVLAFIDDQWVMAYFNVGGDTPEWYITNIDYGADSDDLIKPTHWRPLPPAPAKAVTS